MNKTFNFALLIFAFIVGLNGPRAPALDFELGTLYTECLSAEDCNEDESCIFPVGSCGEDGQAGACRPRGGVCYTLYDPVCGCNGTTYGNSCFANSAGVSVRFRGVCENSEVEIP